MKNISRRDFGKYLSALGATALFGCSRQWQPPTQTTIDWFVKKKGYTYRDILDMQVFFNCYSPGCMAVNGKYNPDMATAVHNFQMANGLADSDGLVGNKTLAVMVATYETNPNICAERAYEGLSSLLSGCDKKTLKVIREIYNKADRLQTEHN